jgi:leucyl-tRNA synthetase
MSADYKPLELEPKWQERWREAGIFEIEEPAAGKPKAYVLEMLPYPSGRLHMGHVRNYAMGDVVSRFRRLRGDSVLHPMGWDSFGLPAENAAIERGADPREWTVSNIASMRSQFQRLGLDYDWSREIASHEPAYYRWNQWFFLKFLEAGLAYRKKRGVHWCPQCNTVLANEQVEDGACYRCDSTVELRELKQWFFRTTAFQAELLDALAEMPDWPEALRKRQSHWFGRSEGATIRFPVKGAEAEIEVFTTRIDTIFGCTFVVVAPDHPVLDEMDVEAGRRAEIDAFAARVAKDQVQDRGEEKEKEGLATGVSAVNPFTGEDVPVWVANFVVKDYGTGAVMSVPGHDLRDHEFAGKYGLPIVPVICPPDSDEPEEKFTDDGVLAGSGEFSGLSSADARREMVAHGATAGFAAAETQYRLRDWGVSRQRFWGTPIPIIHCDGCGSVPVPVENLPVVLPERVELTGEASPLARHEEFANVDCPRCGAAARRDPDTMDTFVDSSWYFYRYLDPRNEEAPFSAEAVADWMPIDLYIGGPEHAVGHLIYCRWWSRAMKEIGLAVPEEPIVKMVHHGMMTMATLSCPEHGWRYPDEVLDWNYPDDVDGATCRECGSAVKTGDIIKMSKSKRNVIDPDALIQRFGADTLRLFVMFAAPPGKELDWSESGAEGMFRFLGRVWRMVTREGLAGVDPGAPARSPAGETLETLVHQTIHRVTHDIAERLHFNTGIAALMELTNALYQHAPVNADLPADAGPVRRAAEALTIMLSPYAPHLCEELWSRLGREGFVAVADWPVADPARLVEDSKTLAVQVNGKMRGQVEVPAGASQDEVMAAAESVEKIAAHLAGKQVVKVVHVPDRLLNVVVK